MKAFVKWSGFGLAAGVAVVLVYRAIDATRQRLDAGLAHAERIAGEASRAVEKTHTTLEETNRAIHDMRRTLS